jgi:hypothetical protein
MDVGTVNAPTIRRSQICKRSRQSVSISRYVELIEPQRFP